MIIAGNSHVSLFDKKLVLPEKNNELIKVYWIGPIKIEHFFNNHSFALKIHKLFQEDYDWKFLSIGNHDVSDLVSNQDFIYNQDEYFEDLENKYFDVFSKLSKYQNFSWMLSFQQYENIQSNLSNIEILETTQEFNYRIKKICSNLNIPVIDPLKNLCDDRGFVLREYLKKDKQHFNYKALPFYLEELKKVTNSDISIVEDEYYIKNNFKVDAESFIYLFLENIGIKDFKYDIKRIELNTISFCENILKNKDMEMKISLDTELSDLLTSLELVEVYTFISQEFNVEINFKVDLRELDNLAKMIYFIEKYIEKTLIYESDFLNSFKLDFNTNKEQILYHESKISKVSDRVFENFEKCFNFITNEAFKYGIIYHWFSLIKASRKEYNDAIKLSIKAEDINLIFPVIDNRTNYYRDMWKNNGFNN